MLKATNVNIRAKSLTPFLLETFLGIRRIIKNISFWDGYVLIAVTCYQALKSDLSCAAWLMATTTAEDTDDCNIKPLDKKTLDFDEDNLRGKCSLPTLD